MSDVVVIGAGLAGLTTATRLMQQGKSVALVSKGIGGLQLGQGTIDFVGYDPDLVDDPIKEIDRTVDETHPYSHFSAKDAAFAAEWIRDLMGEELLVGDGQRNYRLPTALGALRPTALPQPSMVFGEPEGRNIVLVGFDRLKDFYPDLVAENLRRQTNPDGTAIEARAIHVDLEVREGEVDSSGLQFARALDSPEVQEELCELVRPHLLDGEVVGFPAVLGLADTSAWKQISKRLGHDVFEVVIQPPSVPGMRLNERFTRLVKSGMTDPGAVPSIPAQTGVLASRSRFILGGHVVGFDAEGDRLVSVTVASAGHPTTLRADEFVLATGGFEAGSLAMDSYGNVTETLFDLPLHGVTEELINGDYWGEQPLFKVGLKVDEQMRPLDAAGQVVYSNLRAAGGLIGGANRWREKSGDGIALLTGLRAADSIASTGATETKEGSKK
ncbi:MAG: glycerol-3-phosphate dehydrogenase subunit GlpB [Scrofimicrobium sp.]